MSEKKKNFYTISQVQELVFEGSLSKTTIHQLVKKGKIPSVSFMSKKLIPSYWVEECLAKANCNPSAVEQQTV
ncbi:helix-turn-helix transcriptional regulator [Anaerosinus massiliensis]|uniref:helix-turn-helix transcriptional regulator n=1 Tax=Massilibacillus massiliensis TaxID=1806837 RepID=UPI000DA61D29|nr:helix-turn-helix domain-containing protein [Massilibacillus massiliensis]